MLLEKYRVRLVNPPCNPSSETVNAIVEFDDDLANLLPYLNAELGPGIYDPGVPFLRLLKGGKSITIHPKKIAISKLQDDREAGQVLAWLKEIINSVNDRRADIQPSYESIGKVNELDLFRLLPRTNCGKCGHSTCLAFAAAVVRGESSLEDCLPLFSGRFEQQKQTVLRLFGIEP